LAGTGLDSRAWAEASGLAGEHRHGEREASSSTPASSLISPDSRPQLAGFPVSSTTTRRHRRLRPRDLGLRRRSPRARGPGPTSDNRRSSGVCNSLFVLSAVVVAGGTLSAQSRSSWFRRSPEVSDAPIVVLNQLLVWIVCSALIIV
jgi:hypothetical protein